MKRSALGVIITLQLFVAAAAQGVPAGRAQAAASVAGAYHYKTYRPGKEGYDKTLKVEDKGGGRLHVSLSGAYMYRANGEETMHEANGEGDASLRGNIATASVTADGAEGPCRVVITFEGDRAGVKADDTCDFNVVLDGLYVKEKAAGRPAAVNDANVNAGGLRQVSYDRLEDFVNDTDRNKTGLRYVITSVPAEKISKITAAEGASQRGLFYLASGEDDTGAATGFVTSGVLVKGLRAQPRAGAARLRVTATLVEFAGEFDVYRISFVTKVEGLSEDGWVVWSVAGVEPARVKMRQ